MITTPMTAVRAMKCVVTVMDRRSSEFCFGCVLVKSWTDPITLEQNTLVVAPSSFVKDRNKNDLNVQFFDEVQSVVSVAVKEDTFHLLRTNDHSKCEEIKLIEDELIIDYLKPSQTFMMPHMNYRHTYYYQPTFITLETLESYGSQAYGPIVNSRDYFLVSCPYFLVNCNGETSLAGSPVFTEDGSFAIGFVLRDCHNGNQMKVAISAKRFRIVMRELMSELENSSLRLKKMQKGKKGGVDFTRRFHKEKRGCKIDLVSGHLRDGDSNQDVFAKLPGWVKSDICKSVVSISLCNGDITLFSCSGIAIAHKGYHLTMCLTSASLVRAFDGKTNEQYYELKIKVRCEGNEVYKGFLAEYDLDHNFAVVNIDAFLGVHVGSSQCVLESVLRGEAYVVGRGVSGDLISRSVELGCDLSVSKHGQDLESKTSEAWEGGIVFSLNGESVGMNLFLVMGRTIFLPWGTIFEHLRHFGKSWQRFGAHVVGQSNSRPEGQEQLDLDSMGYPLPSTKGIDGMILVNTFEEFFGDIHGKGVWSKFSGQASSSLSSNVVALASYNGGKRFFACTGFFIPWNESTIILTSASLIRSSGDGSDIVENLRIVVSPCDGKIREGTLELYNLHYNVALVSVKDFYVRSPANTVCIRYSSQVAAVGRCFESGALMATSGKLVPWTGTLDCDCLVRSSCKITKAGIGGPLVTLDGNVLGMNFYDKKIGTPFLSMPDIFLILKSSKSHPSAGPFWKMDGDDAARLNRWPVPMPCWRLPNYVDEDKSDDDDSDDSVEYSYVRGVKVILL